MELTKTTNTENFPLIEIALNSGDSVNIQRGSMIYHTPNVSLTTSLNSNSSGIGGLLKAVGRAMVSGESVFVTKAVSNSDGGKLAIAPAVPGEVIALECGPKQYRLNDGAFLALDGNCSYTMESQGLGKSLFGGQGGLFVMTTNGNGTLLVESFGSLRKLELNNEQITIDNSHVVAWSTSLDYHIHTENGFLQSIGTGEGIVNTFSGTGEIYVQSLNLENFASMLKPYFPDRN